MAASALIRLFIVFLILIALALYSGLAWGSALAIISVPIPAL